MAYRLLADLLVILHGAFILFALLGGLLALRWRLFAWFHIPAFLWAAYIELSGGICPLTPLENRFRYLGEGSVYQGDFIDHYLMPLLYPEDLTRQLQIAFGLFVLLFNAAIYAWIGYRSRRKQ